MSATMVPAPPGGPARVVGGLLGVAGGEMFGEARSHEPERVFRPAAWAQGVGHDWPTTGPVTTALVDLGHGYVARRGRGVPVEVAERSCGVAGPGWLLAVAVVRTEPRRLVGDTLELAAVSGVPIRALGEYVSYVELAAGLFAGRSVPDAVDAATGDWSSAQSQHEAAQPKLCGEAGVDALSAGIWALTHPAGLAEVLRILGEVTTPSVAAAAVGLLGLRDGADAVPACWQRRLRSAAACVALAPGLVRARCPGHHPEQRGREGREEVKETFLHGPSTGASTDGVSGYLHEAGLCVKAGAL